jgi:hypothetical protein
MYPSVYTRTHIHVKAVPTDEVPATRKTAKAALADETPLARVGNLHSTWTRVREVARMCHRVCVDVKGKGNCQFHAIAFALDMKHADLRRRASEEILRNTARFCTHLYTRTHTCTHTYSTHTHTHTHTYTHN